MSSSENAPSQSANRFTQRAAAAAAAKVKPQPTNPTQKALRVKISSLQRNIRDTEYAKKEVVTELARLEDIRVNKPDRVVQQQNVVSEARMMVPHCENRVRDSIRDLQEFTKKESANISPEWEDVALVPKVIEAAEEMLAKDAA